MALYLFGREDPQVLDFPPKPETRPPPQARQTYEGAQAYVFEAGRDGHRVVRNAPRGSAAAADKVPVANGSGIPGAGYASYNQQGGGLSGRGGMNAPNAEIGFGRFGPGGAGRGVVGRGVGGPSKARGTTGNDLGSGTQVDASGRAPNAGSGVSNSGLGTSGGGLGSQESTLGYGGGVGGSERAGLGGAGLGTSMGAETGAAGLGSGAGASLVGGGLGGGGELALGELAAGQYILELGGELDLGAWGLESGGEVALGACTLEPGWELSTGVVVGPVLAWAELTSGLGVRSAADLQQWASWSTGLVDLHKGHCKGADFGRAPTSAGAVVDTGVVDTLEARLENARRRHEANKYGDLPWAVVEAGIRAAWAMEHPSWPVSPRPVNTEGGVDAGVNAGGGPVGTSAGGTSRQRGVIPTDEVGGVQVRGVRSSATAGS
ncbi:unnamed protein product [Closterium sp. NIES-54]